LRNDVAGRQILILGAYLAGCHFLPGILRQLRGEAEAARRDWERVLDLAPVSAAADLAAQNLALIEAGPSQR
jgi:hypothetical protein